MSTFRACHWRDDHGTSCAKPVYGDNTDYCAGHTLYVARSQCHDCGPPSLGPFCPYHQEVKMPNGPQQPAFPRFYMVYVEAMSSPTVRHQTYEAAKLEAERLARSNHGRKVIILQALAACTLPGDVRWEQVAP